MATLPPQAYTREMLTTAYHWLQAQPESIRKLAQTSDALVGLYLRAQRYGQVSAENDAPVTSQAFASDLKVLAEGLRQFEDPVRQNEPVFSAPRPQPAMSLKPEQMSIQGISPATQSMIREVRSQLNLSSDAETINFLTAIAYKNIKNLLA